MNVPLSEFIKNSLDIKEEPSLKMFMLPERTFDKYLEIHNINDEDINEHTFEKYLLDGCFQIEYDYEKFQNYHRNMYIDETLGESWNYTRLIDKIKEKFNIYNLETDKRWVNHNNVTAFTFNTDKDIRKDDEIMHMLDLFNYYVLYSKNTNGEWLFKLDPRKPKEITNKIYNENNGILYHILSETQYQKCLKRGLNPRKIDIENENEKIYRPYRRFFISNKDKNECRVQLMLLEQSIQKQQKIKNTVIIKIDLNKFQHKLKFFVDSTADGYSAYFTLDYIPPMCIEKIKLDDLKK